MIEQLLSILVTNVDKVSDKILAKSIAAADRIAMMLPPGVPRVKKD